MSGGGKSTLSCEIRIIRAENVELGRKMKGGGGGGCVFVRMYLSAGNNNGRVQLNTQELPVLSSINSNISSSSSFKWDQSFSLECNGKADAVNELKGGSVALELRWRPTSTRWGQSSSKLLGRAELPWEPAFSSPIQAWVPLITNKASIESAGLLVAMTVKAQVEVESGRRRGGGEGRCGCSGDHGCANVCQDDYELFALAAALEGF